MSIIETLVLGIIQGLTEFIPVSSSGHLLLAHELFGTTESTLAFDVALHVGTLLALVLYFHKDLWQLVKNISSKNKEGRLSRLLVLATIPAAVAGFLFADYIDENLRSPMVVAVTLGGMGIIMLLVDRRALKRNDKEVSTKQGLCVGFAQVLALIPGVSRSGATITAGIFAGLDRKQAAKFSFLLAIPIIAGSALGVFVKDGDSLTVGSELFVGMLAAFASGLFAIKFMLRIIADVGLRPFAYYRITLSLIVFVTLL